MMNSIETTSWRTFPLVDVFEMSNTKSIVQRDIIPDSGTTPYVTASEKNNGVLTYISCPPEWLDKGGVHNDWRQNADFHLPGAGLLLER